MLDQPFFPHLVYLTLEREEREKERTQERNHRRVIACKESRNTAISI